MKMFHFKFLYYVSLISAIICGIGMFIWPDNHILTVFTFWNTFNLILINHVWRLSEAQEKRKKKRKVQVKDLSPKD